MAERFHANPLREEKIQKENFLHKTFVELAACERTEVMGS